MTQMTASVATAKYIQVEIALKDKGVYVATSADIDGLLVVSKDPELLTEKLVPQAIADLFKASGVEAFVTPAEEREPTPAFVAMPTALAKRKLEEMESSR